MTKIFLRKKISTRIAEGHPWVFENEIGDETGSFRPGDIVSVYSSNGSFIGKGYINPQSKIRIRLLTRDETVLIDDTFLHQRLNQAWMLRKNCGMTRYARVVFAESDFLPGIIIDKFNHCLVLQTLTLGADRQKQGLLRALQMIFPGHPVYERNDAPVRLLEALELKKGFLSGNQPTCITLASPDEVYLLVDIENGPRTGIYWEQWWIATRLRHLAAGAEVLDAFSGSGCCGLHAAKFGAKHITCIDEDEQALHLVREQIRLNGFSDIFDFHKGNTFDLLKSWSSTGKKFDLIVLDPPALARSREQIPKAMNGYKELHVRALKLLKQGGFLFTSCSTYLITEDMILDLIRTAAKDNNRSWRIIGRIPQAKDHPFLWNLASGNYFKGFILQVL